MSHLIHYLYLMLIGHSKVKISKSLVTISFCIGNFNPNGVGTKTKPIIFDIRKLILWLLILSSMIEATNDLTCINNFKVFDVMQIKDMVAQCDYNRSIISYTSFISFYLFVNQNYQFEVKNYTYLTNSHGPIIFANVFHLPKIKIHFLFRNIEI